MRISIELTLWTLLLTFLLTAPPALAQVGGSRSQAGAPPANQLPLSGRAGQTGSVMATESPVPGITSSVNTINPTIAVQGPYSGSASSTAKIPFSGKLSLREAVDRAV